MWLHLLLLYTKLVTQERRSKGKANPLFFSFMADPKQTTSVSEKKKETNVAGIGKEEKQSSVHEEETHGRSDDIDEKTKVDEVKGPGVIERMKEEMEAIVDAVTPNKT